MTVRRGQLRILVVSAVLSWSGISVAQALGVTAEPGTGPLAVQFKFVKVEGLIQYQLPLSAEWRTARLGRSIPDGSILMVPPNATVSVSADDSLGREGLDTKVTKITIKSPMIVRLSRSAFRKVTLEKGMISALPNALTLNAIDKFKKINESFSDAWKKEAMGMLAKDWVSDELLKLLSDASKETKKEEPVSVSGSTGRIKIETPTNNQVALASEIPAEIPLRWQREGLVGKGDITNYNIYFWKDGEQKIPYAQVIGNKLTVKVTSTGAYNAQVQTIDGSYKSKVKKVKVFDKNSELAGGKETNAVAELDIPGRVLSQRIKVRSPGRNLVWYSKSAWPVILFEWERPETCARDVKYRFIVENASGKLVFSKNLNDEDFFWAPPPEFAGVYRWRVDGISCASPSGDVISELTSTPPRRLSLVRQDLNKLLDSSVSQGSFRGTLVIDSL